MRQHQAIEFQATPLVRDSNSTVTDKKISAPVELSIDELRNVAGGLLPNGTWSSSDSLPNGTW
jgi:hypothetical protein